MTLTASRPQLLTVAEAAALLNVSDRTIRRWIEAEKVPYLKLPGGGYRIPQTRLLASLSGTYDLRREMEALDERFADMTENQVRAALAAADNK
jgi:excisionase family DNA binding protein